MKKKDSVMKEEQEIKKKPNEQKNRLVYTLGGLALVVFCFFIPLFYLYLKRKTAKKRRFVGKPQE